MPVGVTRRDYSLIGLDAKLAVETGLSAARLKRRKSMAQGWVDACAADFRTGAAKGAPVGVDLATDLVKVEGGRVFLKLG
jgi:hypothetical protein